MLLPGSRLCVVRPLRDLLGASMRQHAHPSPGAINKPSMRWQSNSITRHLTTTPIQSWWKQAPVARSFTHASSPKFNSNTATQATPGNGSKPIFDTSKRLIGSQAQGAKNTIKTPTSSTSTGAAGSGFGSGAVTGSSEAGNTAQNNLDWKILRELSRYIWPKNDTNAKIRVIAASTLLVLSQLVNIQVPFFFKEIVDNLNVEFPVGSTVAMVVGASIVGCNAISLFFHDHVFNG